MGYGFDRILYPVSVEFDGNTIVETGTEYDVPTGTYYVRTESVLSSIETQLADYDALLDAIDTALTGVNLSFEWVAPTGYDHEESLRMVGDTAWSLDFAAAAWDFPPELIGFPPDQTSTVSSTDEGGGNHVIEGTRSVLGCWIAAPIVGVKATDKTSTLETEAYASTDPINERTKIVTMRDRRQVRMLRWEWVPGMRIHGGTVRGEQATYRNLAGISEATDGFQQEGATPSLRAMYERVSSDAKFLVYHDLDDRTRTDPPADQYEGVRLASIGAVQSFDDWYTRQRPGGELHEVEIPVLVVESAWDY